MPFNLKGRHFLSMKDNTPEEIDFLLQLSIKLKQDKYAGLRGNNLAGKNIALIFEKPSTRTRCAFVVACVDEGAHPEYLGKDDIQLGKKETVKDTARVLGRMFDGIQFRGFKHETVEGLAQYAGVPVWNGLTDLYHPTQILADFMTVLEVKGRLKGITFAYVGDGRNNMANSLMIGAAKMGMDFRIVAPKPLFPAQELVAECREFATERDAKITITDDIASRRQGRRRRLYRRLGIHGRRRPDPRTHQAAESLPDQPRPVRQDRQPRMHFPPLPARLSQHRDQAGQAVPRHLRSQRGNLRKQAFPGLRRSREPRAYDQGRDGRHAGQVGP